MLLYCTESLTRFVREEILAGSEDKWFQLNINDCSVAALSHTSLGSSFKPYKENSKISGNRAVFNLEKKKFVNELKDLAKW